MVLRHPDPGRVAPPPAPPGRLLTWTAYASAGLILLFGVSVVYVLAARAFPGAAPDPVVGSDPPAATASVARTASPAAAAPAVVGTLGPGHCPPAVTYGGGRPEALPQRAPTRVTVCRYRFPTAGAAPGTLVGTPVDGRPRDFDAAARAYLDGDACRPAKPDGDAVPVDVVYLVYGNTPAVLWIVRAPCADPRATDPAAALQSAVDDLLGPP
ncbi:hypothetical protein Val02_24860 [Virgisporangium aliadipatigenens]|uniref:DUF3558 domain-containing protein n=1 Tax=Virgisporangium aliadipatigenens TaxID=741659 RepID=A0A8J3YKI4_9ACTN|nr:hypothetical protein Val02_24860 [Virgisporangium aliadipatigenens]